MGITCFLLSLSSYVSLFRLLLHFLFSLLEDLGTKEDHYYPRHTIHSSITIRMTCLEGLSLGNIIMLAVPVTINNKG